jgi:hypothetical protein
VGKYRLSKRLVKDALSDMLGVELSVGSVSNLEGEMSQALAPAAAEALAFVQVNRTRGVMREPKSAAEVSHYISPAGAVERAG